MISVFFCFTLTSVCVFVTFNTISFSLTKFDLIFDVREAHVRTFFCFLVFFCLSFLISFKYVFRFVFFPVAPVQSLNNFLVVFFPSSTWNSGNNFIFAAFRVFDFGSILEHFFFSRAFFVVFSR
uniref:(northern house mosquito) hypothetical protein n=1 Tax=Culex pipiens TaxID=7175 RepID=A0A8D8NW20_CULPI